MPTTGSTLLKGKVDVKWGSSDKIVTYRRGSKGKMELRAVTAASGGRYQPEWLPVLKVVKEERSTEPFVKHFSVGDRVQIVATVAEMREKQAEHGGWTESMKKAIGQAGTVLKVDSDGDIHVKFDKLDLKWCLNPTVVKKLTTFSIGQIVRVRDDVDTLKAMRIQFGSEGNKVVYAMAEETGRITKVEIDEDGGEHVHLELMKESSLKPLPAMKPEWLEAVPMAVKLHEKLSKLESKLGNLFVEAAQEGDLYLHKKLLKIYKVSVDVDHKSTPGLTALHLACRKFNLQVVEWLLGQKANIEKADDKGRTAVYHAVKGGEEKVLQLLIQKGADLDTVTKTRGLTALHKAITNGHKKCAEILIENGCNVNCQDEYGDTPLHNAVYMMKNAMVLDGDAPTVFDALINSGRVDLNIRNKKGLSVFHAAVGVGNLRVVQYFLSLKNAAEFVLEVIPKKKLNALHIASMNGYCKIAHILLDCVKKLDNGSMQVLPSFVNAKDRDDQTPLMMASVGDHYSLIELLVEAKAGVNLTDKYGDTAMSRIMMKVGMNEPESPIPTSKFSATHEIYEAIYSTPIFAETMAKHPSLSAACYLISNGGNPEAGEGLSKSSDTTINNILRSFVSNDPDNSRNGAQNQEPDVEMMDTCSGSLLPLNSFGATHSGSRQHISDKSGSDARSQWTLKPKGYRKNTDLLLDVHGNTYTKRSPNIWQCTKRSDKKNKCPALIKEKILSDGTIKYEILKSIHKHADLAPHSPRYSNKSSVSEVPETSLTFINIPSPTPSDESHTPENDDDDDDTVMEACESSQSSTSCDKSTGSTTSEHLPNQSPLASQLANSNLIANIQPQSSLHQYDGAPAAAAGKSTGRNKADKKAANNESKRGGSGYMTRSKSKKPNQNTKQRSLRNRKNRF